MGNWKLCNFYYLKKTSCSKFIFSPDDPLMSEIASEYSQNPELFKKNARTWTEKYCENF